MIERSIKRLSLRALVVDDELPARPPKAGRPGRWCRSCRGRAVEVVEAASAEDGSSVIVSDSAIHADAGGLDAGRRQRMARPAITTRAT